METITFSDRCNKRTLHNEDSLWSDILLQGNAQR